MKLKQAYKCKYQTVKLKNSLKDQQYEKIARRTPYTCFEDSRAKSMIQNNFISSTATRQSRIDHDIMKTKSRLLTSTSQLKNNVINLDNHKSESCIITKPNKKISIKKNVDRCCDQRLFNNFKQFDVSMKNTRHFSKYLPRKNTTKQSSKQQQIDSLRVAKTKEMLVFNHLSMSCIFNYSTKIYPQDKVNTETSVKQIEFQSLQKARQQCSKQKQFCQFYRYTGRQVFSSFERRFAHSQIKPSHSQSEAITILQAQRIKSQLKQARLRQYDKKRKLYFKRGQICDKKYFKLPKQQQR